jgi:hypothetical protein
MTLQVLHFLVYEKIRFSFLSVRILFKFLAGNYVLATPVRRRPYVEYRLVDLATLTAPGL